MEIKNNYKVGFIGVGNMASAMIAGMTGVGGFSWDKLYLYDIVSNKNVSAFAENGANIASTVKELYGYCDCIVLSVKPQVCPTILDELAEIKDRHHVLFITICAGIGTDTVSQALGGVPVVRAMPNTPMLIGKGVTAVCRNEAVADDELDFACSVFASAGEIIKIDESEMNRIICVNSSSPAYVFMFIKAMCDGASAQGLNGEALCGAICNVVSGAAEMLAKSDKTPEELISMVCSKGGTTERAVTELQRLGFSDAVVSAMQKCTDRADELGNIKQS